MKVTEILKNRNRTLLEIDMADLFWTLAATVAGVFVPMQGWGLEKTVYFSGLWTAAILVMIAAYHMQKSLDRALDCDEKTAAKLAYQAYLIRYAALGVVLALTAVTGLLNPVVLCLSYLFLMKAAVYSQPLTHKLCNRLFHETEPALEDLPQEEPQGHALTESKI